jgi:PAS domain S-box-containing protein
MVIWSDELFRIFQRDPLEGAPSFAQHPAFYHPDDMARLQQAVETAVADGTPYELEMRANRKDGETRACIARGVAEMGPGGRAVRLFGSLQDITERKRAEEALRESEENHRRSLENSPLGIRIIDAHGKVLFANRAVLDIYGYDSIEELRATPTKERYTPQSYAEYQVRKKKRTQGEHVPSEYEISIVRKNGEIRRLQVMCKEVEWDGRTQHQVIYLDITERKQVEEALYNSEREISTIVENTPDMIVRFDAGLRYLYCNKAVEYSLGLPLSTLIGKTPKELGAPTGLAEFVDKSLRRALKTGQQQEVEQELPTPSGLKYFQTRIVPERDDEGRIISLLAITRDITLRKQAEAALLENEKKNRELVEQLHRLVESTITAQESERERICLEVHDGVAQTVAAAFQYLQGLESNLAEDSPDADLIGKAKAQMKHAIQESREIVNSLQPAALKDLGLIPTLSQEVHRIEEDNGWKINFDAYAQRYPPAIEIGLYRIIHEAITNIKKHTRTRGVDISIQNDGQYINVLIKDHGKGFDKDSPDIQKKKGIGLISMRKRAELLQGTLNIESIRGKGTSVMIKIPFDGRV